VVTIYVSCMGEKMGYHETVHQLFVDFKKACDSLRREIVYNILTEFGVPMEQVKLIKMRQTKRIVKSV
jgi:hypothetical protein